MSVRILIGDCRERLADLEADSVQTCVTSPPYFGLRDYEVDGQIGLELTPQEFVSELVSVFREVRRVLRPDGTLWLNLGDSYASRPNGSIGKEGRLQGAYTGHSEFRRAHARRKPGVPEGVKHKDLLGIPWRVAFALQADGWYLRQDIVWSKPNPMPESVADRCTKAHEYVFLLSKSERYYFDGDAISEPASPNTKARVAQNVAAQAGSARANGGGCSDRPMKAVIRSPKARANAFGNRNNESFVNAISAQVVERRNKRSVWTVATEGFSEAHFATYPPALIEPCILAGSPPGSLVLDPFGGAGTTGLVAERLGRDCVLIELNPEYAAIADRRLRGSLVRVDGAEVGVLEAGPLFEGVA